MKFLQRPRLMLVAILAASIGLSSSAFAATATTPGEGLQLMPPLISSQANPGQSVTLDITLRNISSGTLAITAVANDFGAKGEDGQPQIFLDNSAATTRYSLRQWITPLTPLRLASQQSATVPVHVTIPANAEPGGHYAVIRFSGATPDVNGGSGGSSSTGSLGLNASIGALVLFTVNGNIEHKLSAVDVAADNADGQRHKLFEHGPITLVERLKNDGSVHEVATGKVDITNILGKTTASVAFNDKKGNILPGAIRKFTQQLPKKGLFGRYTIKGEITYDNGVKLVLPASSFWVIPYRLLLVVLVGLVIVYLLLRGALKRYNRHIIAQARRR